MRSTELSTDLAVNEKTLRDIFQECSDIIFRTMCMDPKVLLIYIDGLTDTQTLDKIVLKPILLDKNADGLNNTYTWGEIIEQQLVPIARVQTVSALNEVTNGILKANIAILVEGENQALIANLKKSEKRGVEEPEAEVSVRGPRDGFTETLRTNTSLIRRRIRSVELKMESVTVGQFSQTDIVIAYILELPQIPSWRKYAIGSSKSRLMGSWNRILLKSLSRMSLGLHFRRYKIPNALT
ncbi:Spore germination protein B1 [compost metagenome]